MEFKVMQHGAVANTIVKPLRDLLIEHIDGSARFDLYNLQRKTAGVELMDLGLIAFETRDARPEATRITDDGRKVLACILSFYAENLLRSGYTGLEAPSTRRAIAAAAEVDRIEWSPQTWRVATRFGDATFGGWRQVQVFDLLYRRRGTYGLTVERIVDIVCADDADGGVASGTIKGIIKEIRRTVAPAGVRVVAGSPSSRSGYSLAVREPQASIHA